MRNQCRRSIEAGRDQRERMSHDRARLDPVPIVIPRLQHGADQVAGGIRLPFLDDIPEEGVGFGKIIPTGEDFLCGQGGCDNLILRVERLRSQKREQRLSPPTVPCRVLGGQVDGGLEGEGPVPLQGVGSVKGQYGGISLRGRTTHLSVTKSSQYSRRLRDDSAASNCWSEWRGIRPGA